MSFNLGLELYFWRYFTFNLKRILFKSKFHLRIFHFGFCGHYCDKCSSHLYTSLFSLLFPLPVFSFHSPPCWASFPTDMCKLTSEALCLPWLCRLGPQGKSQPHAVSSCLRFLGTRPGWVLGIDEGGEHPRLRVFSRLFSPLLWKQIFTHNLS